MSAMKTIRIVTSSDDNIDIDGLVEGNGMCTSARGGVYGIVEIMDRAAGSGAVIELHYTSDLSDRIGLGIWVALVSRPDEGVGLLPVRISAPNIADGYNIEIEVDAPQGAEVLYYVSDDGPEERRNTTVA